MSKYNNTKVKYDGYIFDSKAEHRRYCELRLLEKAGEIRHLKVHPKYTLLQEQENERGVIYTPDFEYCEKSGDSYFIVAEDVKSEITKKDKAYIIKRKLFKLKYPDIEFREVVI